MCSIIATLLLLLGVAAGGLMGYAGISTTATMPEPTAPAVAEITPEVLSCASVSQSQDMTDMLAVVDNAFESGLWKLSVDSSQESKTTSTWTANSLGAVAYLEWLHYDCGVSQAQIDQYYSPQSFKILFAHYDSYRQTVQCSITGLKLFQFDAVFQGQNYHINYWVDQASQTRVAGLMLVFPVSSSSEEAYYAGRLFPQLPTCEQAAG